MADFTAIFELRRRISPNNNHLNHLFKWSSGHRLLTQSEETSVAPTFHSYWMLWIEHLKAQFWDVFARPMGMKLV